MAIIKRNSTFNGLLTSTADSPGEPLKWIDVNFSGYWRFVLQTKSEKKTITFTIIITAWFIKFITCLSIKFLNQNLFF